MNESAATPVDLALDIPGVSLRVANRADAPVLTELYLAMLLELGEHNIFITPEAENVRLIVENLIVPSAEAGYPVLLAERDGRAIAAIFWTEYKAFYHVPQKLCCGFGAYVVPSERRRGLASQMFVVAMAMLKNLGVAAMLDSAPCGRPAGDALMRGLGGQSIATVYLAKT